MKKILFLLFSLASIALKAQNVGIGTSTPQATLDVKGNQRFGGVNNYMTFDTISGKIEWRNANLYVPVSQRLIQHSAAADGLFYNNIGGIGQLEYRNAAGNPVFYTSFMSGNGYFSGNVGIGATTPQTKLHISSAGNEVARLEASSPFLSLYSNGVYKGYFWNSPNSIELGSASGSNLPVTLAPDGNQRVFVTPTGNVGIGTASPYSPLSFNNNFGEKISLYGTSGNNYGLGVQSGLLQIHTDAAATDIVLGYGSSDSFTENMRIRGNGNVGIGNNNPAYQLDINNRIRIRDGGASAGLWLNNTSNTETAFIGMEDDTHVGLYGIGAGWKFGMNTQTGALKINGTEGATGQILTSNGTGAAASWTNPSTKPYAFTIKASQFTTLNAGTLSAPITDIDNTPLFLGQNSTVLYTLSAPVNGDGPGSIDSKGYMVIEIVDGGGRVSYASSDYYIKRSTETTQTASGVAVSLPGGFYTIKARFVRLSVGNGDVSTHGSFNANQQGVQLIVQVLPN